MSRPQQDGDQRWSQLTGRGAVVVMLTVFTLGLLGAYWLGWQVLAGGGFLFGGAAAARVTKRADLPTVVATPPLLFCAAVIGVKAATATGNTALSVAGGVAITLAGAAPWLLAGTVLSLIIALSRGLRQSFRDLRRDLRAGDRRVAPMARAQGDSVQRSVASPGR